MGLLGILLCLLLVVFLLRAAPTATTRQSPTGRPLKDGYRVLYTFAVDPDISLWEKTVTPPGYTVGDKIDQTTQHNTRHVTSAPQSLIETTDGAMTCAYDPVVVNQIIAILGVETTVTCRYADGSTTAHYGYLQDFVPGEMVRGTQPEAACVIVFTNWDQTNGVEAGPAVTSVAGT